MHPPLERARWNGRATTGRRRSAPTALTPQQTWVFSTVSYPCRTLTHQVGAAVQRKESLTQ